MQIEIAALPERPRAEITRMRRKRRKIGLNVVVARVKVGVELARVIVAAGAMLGRTHIRIEGAIGPAYDKAVPKPRVKAVKARRKREKTLTPLTPRSIFLSLGHLIGLGDVAG